MLKRYTIRVCSDGTLGLHMSRAPWDPYPWISGVQDGSSSHASGVKIGDTVLEINGLDVLGQKICDLAKIIQNVWENGVTFIEFGIWRSKIENNNINQQSLQKFATCLQNVAQLLECPVCLEVVKPPGWQCCNGHVLCNSCRGRTTKCPVCRVTMGPRGRCLLADKLFTLLAETFPCDLKKDDNCSNYRHKNYHRLQNSPQEISMTSQKDLKDSLKHSSGNGRKSDTSKSVENCAQLRSLPSILNQNDEQHYQRIVVLAAETSVSAQPADIDNVSSNAVTADVKQLKLKRKTYHCPTGKSCFSISSSLSCGSDDDHRQHQSNQWEILTHLQKVHRLSVTHYYGSFGDRMHVKLMNKSISCIAIVPEQKQNLQYCRRTTKTTTPIENAYTKYSKTSGNRAEDNYSSPSSQLELSSNDRIRNRVNLSNRNSKIASASAIRNSQSPSSPAPSSSSSPLNVPDAILHADKTHHDLELFFVARIPIDATVNTNNGGDDSNGNGSPQHSASPTSRFTDGFLSPPTYEKCAIFIWYCGQENDVKKFRTLIEYKRPDGGAIRWKGPVYSMTDSWNFIAETRDFLVLKSNDIDCELKFDIEIKIK